MVEQEKRCIKRNILGNGEIIEIIYDIVSRNVYQSGNQPEIWSSNECFSLPTFDYRAPLKVYFDFTYFCNLECRHCITNSSSRVNRQNELSSESICAIMDELAAIGVLEISVGGGEPLCYSDIFSLLSYARTKGLNVILTTNGILVTPQVAGRLKKIEVSEVRVSFDGSEAVHDYVRGDGNYRKALKAVKVLSENGVKTVPRLTICNDEEEGLEKLFKDLATTGATTVKAGLVFPRGRATQKANKNLFKYRRDNTTAHKLLKLAQEHGLNLKLPGDFALSNSLVDGGDLRLGKRKSCGAGFQTAYISPAGRVQPCSGMPDRIFGDVKSGSFMNSWTNHNAENWRQFTDTHDSWFLCGHTDSNAC